MKRLYILIILFLFSLPILGIDIDKLILNISDHVIDTTCHIKTESHYTSSDLIKKRKSILYKKNNNVRVTSMQRPTSSIILNDKQFIHLSENSLSTLNRRINDFFLHQIQYGLFTISPLEKQYDIAIKKETGRHITLSLTPKKQFRFLRKINSILFKVNKRAFVIEEMSLYKNNHLFQKGTNTFKKRRDKKTRKKVLHLTSYKSTSFNKDEKAFYETSITYHDCHNNPLDSRLFLID